MMSRMVGLLVVFFAVSVQAAPLNVPIDVHWSPQSKAASWPVTAGVPFVEGVAPDEANLRLVSGDEPVPCQVTRTGLWKDGSLRWAWVDFVAEPGRQYALVEGAPNAPPRPLRVVDAAGKITIDTGEARYLFDGGGCFSRIDLGAHAVVLDSGDGCYVVDSQDRRGVFKPTETRVELKGDIRTVVRVEGEYRTEDDQRIAGGVVYYHFYAGMPSARIEHKFIVTENTNDLWFRDIGLTLKTSLLAKAPTKVTFADHGTFPVVTKAIKLVQQAYPHFGKHESKAVVMSGDDVMGSHDVAGNWMNVEHLAVQVPAFAQTFPKAFVAQRDALTIKLWAPEAGQELDFRTDKVLDWYFGEDWIPRDNDAWKQSNNAQGTARTHDIWIHPHAGDPRKFDPRQLGAFAKATYAKASPQYVAATGVFGPIHPYDPQRFPEAERAIEDHYDRTVGFKEQVFPNNGYLYYRAYPWASQGWELKETSGGGQWYPQIHRLSRSLDYNFKRHLWILAMRSPQRRYMDDARDFTRFQHDMLWSNAETEGRDTRGRLYQAYFHSPIVWAGRGAYLSYASSEDVIQFVYSYFLQGDYHSRDMVEAWIAQLKKEYGDDAAAAAEKQDRSDSLLRMIGSAYELHHDPWLYDFSHAFLQHTVHPEKEVGLDLAGSQIAKTGDVYSAYFYNWVHTRDPLALVPLKRFAEFDYRRGRLQFMTRSSAIPYAYAMKYYADGDEGFASMLTAWLHHFGQSNPTLADIGVDRDAVKLGYTGSIAPIILTGSGPTFYGIPMAMQVALDSGASMKSRPLVVKPHPTQPVYIALNRKASRDDTLDLFVNNFGDLTNEPVLLDASGKRAAMEVVTRDEHRVTKPPGIEGVLAHQEYYLSYESQIFYRLRIPASVPPGTYTLDVGDHVSFQLLASTIDDAIAVAPDGIVIENGHRYYFPVESGREQLTVFAHRKVVIEDPQGNALNEPQNETFTVEVADGGTFCVYTVPDKYMSEGQTGSDTFFRLMDAPLVIAKDDASRLFAVDLSRYPSAEQDGVREAPENGFAFVEDGKFGGSALMNYRVVSLPTAADSSNPPHAEGTVEFWWRPRWSAGDFSMEQSTQRLYLFHMDPIGLMYSTDNPNSGRTDYYNESRILLHAMKAGDTRAWLYPTAGEWYHVAATWKIDGENSEVDLYINGRKRSYGHYREGMMRSTPASALNAVGAALRFGSARFHHQADGGDEFDELRVSRTVRYTEDFTPPGAPFEVDGDTWLLMHFDGHLKANRAGEIIEAEVTSERRLY